MAQLLITMALIAAVAAEAPYYSDRPSSGAPSFNYPAQQFVSQPQPAPAPAPQYQPAPAPQYPAPAPAPQYYAPAPVQYPTPAAAPAPQYHAPAPAPSPIQYVQYPPTVSVGPQPQYQQGYNYERPSIAPAFVYRQPQPAPQAPQPAPVPIQVRQPAPQPQGQGYSYYAPQQSYAPQQGFALASQQQNVIAAAQAYQPQLRQALPAQSSQFSFQPQAQQQYQSFENSAPQVQVRQLQAQPASSGFNQQSASSGFNQQSTVLDSHVVDRLSNILAQNEESQARGLGYYHRVSGVSLEAVNPSVELSSFIQNVPLSSAQPSSESGPSLHELARGSATSSASGAQSSSVSSLSTQGSGSSASGRALASSYGIPTVVDNRLGSSDTSKYNFVPPQNQPPSAYGSPN